MFTRLLSGSFGLFLTLVLFVTGINGLFPVIADLNKLLISISQNFADVFPWLNMDSTAILLFISLAKTMAAFVYFADVLGLADNCMNAVVTTYILAIFSGAAYFNWETSNKENLLVSCALIGVALLRQALRSPYKA